MAASSQYTAGDIEVLEGLDPVRRRPGMYIGGTESAGLHHLMREILDNSVDEVMNGYASEISVVLHADGQSLSVEDNGRGIPVDKHPKFKKSALELILTTLHAGGKFSDRNYSSAGGLHGVGASVVNALSEQLDATVCRDGFEWTQSFERGKSKGPVKKGKAARKKGTKVFFRPDPEIFRSVDFSSAVIEKALEEKAFLNKGLKIHFKNESENTEKDFHFPEGVRTYLEVLLERYGEKPVGGESFSFEREDGLKAEVSLCWTTNTQTRIFSYVNGIYTPEGGTHEEGFRSGVQRAFRNYLSIHGNTPRGLKIAAEDIREGLVAVLSVVVPASFGQLQFQGQTKEKLNNAEVSAPVEATVKALEVALNEKPSVATAICDRVFLAARARSAAREAVANVTRKGGVRNRLNLPGKLADCSSSNSKQTELFIVEGDSAGGSAKQGRDRNIQAVLPLRGKVLNSISATGTKIKDNKELTDLIQALGCGSGDSLNVQQLRYDKVIILTDADSDGMHIASLLMAFFFTHMKGIVTAGRLYLGLSPLFRVVVGDGAKASVYWAYDEAEKQEILKKYRSRKTHVTRFKGLGEMNPKTLWETTLDPSTRKLLRIQVDDEGLALDMLQTLLGKDASKRYELIQEHAHRLELDV